MTEKITWKTEKRKLSSLQEHPNNPRILTKKAHEDLKKSFEKFDYAELVAINTDGTILAGHQRCNILREMGRQDEEIEVRVASRKLNKKEADEYLLRSNKNTGAWDFDVLANNFEMEELIEWGFDEKELLDCTEPENGSEDDEGIDFESKLIVEVNCDTESDQKIIFDEMQSRGYKCKILTL